MKTKSPRAKITKKAASKKTASVNKAKTSPAKAKLKIKKIVGKKSKTELKRLGKGLKDISHLFISLENESPVKPSKKTKNAAVKKVSVKKLQKTVVSKPKKTAVKKKAAKKTTVKKTAVKKTAVKKLKKSVVAKVKKTSVSKTKKTLVKKVKNTTAPVSKKTKAIKPKVTAAVLKKKLVKPVSASAKVKKKVSSERKTKLVKTRKIIKKPSKKKTEVIRMPIKSKSEGKAERKLKTPKKNAVSKSVKKTKAVVKKKSQLRPISELSSLLKKKKKTISSASVINAKPEQVVEESKFFTGPAAVSTEAKERQNYELPAGYGDNRIVVQVRDPYWMHSYWEISEDKMNSVRRDLGALLNNAKRILRVYDITNVLFDGSNSNKYFDIDINDYANSWYINPQEAGRNFCVDIGYLLADGRFIMLARSNCISMPVDGPSTITDEEWMIVEEDFNRLYGMSVGLGIGLSSMELRKKISQRFVNLSSGILSSPGAKGVKAQRKFWLKVHTELIVYGATEPGAKVSVQGKPIDLSKDGTFSMRFALPDGQQVIPVKGVSVDGLEERIITPIVSKKTE